MPNPQALDKFLNKASLVVDRASGNIPPFVFRRCSGLILLKSTELGWAVTGSIGGGVLVARRTETDSDDDDGDGSGGWSSPVAVTHGGMGLGVVLGAAEKDIVVVLNHFAMKRFIEGRDKFKIGLEAGFAAGPVGGSAAADVGVTEKGGLATSFVYTFSEGGLIGAEVTASTVSVNSDSNQAFYGTDCVADIVSGKAEVPDNSDVPAFIERIEGMVEKGS